MPLMVIVNSHLHRDSIDHATSRTLRHHYFLIVCTNYFNLYVEIFSKRHMVALAFQY